MHRYANINDLEFIYELILEGSSYGYFNRKYKEYKEAANGLMLELMLILTEKKRINGLVSYALIYEFYGNPIGFVIMSAVEENKGNELWMVAIDKKFRNQGHGKKMILGILEQFKGKNLTLIARCATESEIMYQLLLKNGFDHIATGKEGYRGLAFVL